MATVIASAMLPSVARAQVVGVPPPPPPAAPPPVVMAVPPVVLSAVPTPSLASANANISVGATVVNLGSNFLERLGDQASHGSDRALRNNPNGGGASDTTDPLRLRTWGELYGISATTAAQGDFVGDRRQTYGGVAGLGTSLAPGVNVGLSLDQSRTAIDGPLALQSATLDLTQVGFNASVDKGPWTWAMALVHGFGKIDASRDTGLGIAVAGYDAQIDGALTELSYYWSLDQSRIVPKAAVEYVRATTGAYRELGGLDPVTVGDATVERSRILLGAEIGRYWILDQKILDLSAYGKFVDNFSQNFGSVPCQPWPAKHHGPGHRRKPVRRRRPAQPLHCT